MCGIVGLFLKDPSLQPQLGEMLTKMQVLMTERGPDSAGIAIYSDEIPDCEKITVQSPTPEIDFPNLEMKIRDISHEKITVIPNDTHAVLQIPQGEAEKIVNILGEDFPSLHIMSVGSTIEIYKEVGLPKDVLERFSIQNMSGSHGIGHTRMATESVVDTKGAHPFNTGPDQCLVHNGSLSNPNSLRRQLKRKGVHVQTQNDTEVGAAYVTWKMQQGFSLEEALNSALVDLDGFFTFVVGTKDGFGVVRDHIACKPAIMAETDQYVAFGSEFRVLATLPDIKSAHIFEPEPATVYFWSHNDSPTNNKRAA